MRESKRTRKQATQFEYPDPELEQIMKTIKQQEQAEKHHQRKTTDKQTIVAKTSAKAKQEIDEEKPLKTNVKRGPKLSSRSVTKETSPQASSLEEPPDVLGSSANQSKKEAVFFK